MKYRDSERFFKVTKTIDTIASFVMAIGIVGVALWALALIIPYFREGAYENLTTKIDFGEIDLRYYDTSLLPEKLVLDYKFLHDTIQIFLYFAFLILGGWLFRSTIKDLKEKPVFSRTLSIGFRRLCLLFVAIAVVEFVHVLCAEYFFKAYDVAKLLDVRLGTGPSSALLLQVSHESGYPGFWAFTGICFELISLLFEHGALLQKEHEETL